MPPKPLGLRVVIILHCTVLFKTTKRYFNNKAFFLKLILHSTKHIIFTTTQTESEHYSTNNTEKNTFLIAPKNENLQHQS